MPRLAQPDKTVKLSSKAWTGWELLTGDKTHSLWGTGPAEKDTDTHHWEEKKQYIIYTCQIMIVLLLRKSTGTQEAALCLFFIKLRLLFPLPFSVVLNTLTHWFVSLWKSKFSSMNSKTEGILFFIRKEKKEKKKSKKTPLKKTINKQNNKKTLNQSQPITPKCPPKKQTTPSTPPPSVIAVRGIGLS